MTTATEADSVLGTAAEYLRLVLFIDVLHLWQLVVCV